MPELNFRLPFFVRMELQGGITDTSHCLFFNHKIA